MRIYLINFDYKVNHVIITAIFYSTFSLQNRKTDLLPGNEQVRGLHKSVLQQMLHDSVFDVCETLTLFNSVHSCNAIHRGGVILLLLAR